jgi:DNA (cytosine-5)-methyltransferase 1
LSAYYNEIDPYAAQWLRNLIKEGLIADGEVDTRSIVDVAPDDLRAFTQCHFFAGIGGWSHALRLAGWPDDRPIWTGSCPCQPFSVAGKGAGTDDARHLWPHFHRLITAVRPPVVMGEQVAGAAGYGWLDGVRADLARENYASRGVDIPACSVDAPHIRQRLYWVATDLADTGHMRRGDRSKSGEQELSTPSGLGPATVAVVHSAGEGLEGHGQSGCVAEGGVRQAGIVVSGEGCGAGHMADADSIGGNRVHERIEPRHMEADTERDGERKGGGSTSGSSFWSNHVWLTGADGKSRRSKPGLPLLVNGVSGGISLVRARKDGTEETHIYNRVGALRAFGNAICAPLAAEVIKAFMECEA